MPVAQAKLPLRKGAVGFRVATVQKRLGWLGYSISASSQARQLYGDSTVKAVKAFQAKNWLSATGKVDKKTWRKLEKLAEPVGILPLRCTEKKKSICIDKTTRLLRYVVNGKVAMVTDARFGAPGMETGEGIFSVHEKSFNHVSSRYHTWMPRAMFFNGDEAVHYSPDFASVGYLRGSHGCVGVRDMEKATWLFGQVPVGTRVYVYWS
ncbi:MAG: L,D-transpeptidase family protein [Candidatus Nanopelagicales bacterium]|jgi:lipoprotein-anchoring transpeptidase ErfK/SrfK